MSNREHVFVAVALLIGLSGITAALANCVALNGEISEAGRVVDSLRPDKPGQMRVVATSGAEFAASQNLWMKGRMRINAQSSEGLEEAQQLLFFGLG